MRQHEPIGSLEPDGLAAFLGFELAPNLTDQMKGVRQVLHHPFWREIAIRPEHPWENTVCRTWWRLKMATSSEPRIGWMPKNSVKPSDVQ